MSDYQPKHEPMKRCPACGSPRIVLIKLDASGPREVIAPENRTFGACLACHKAWEPIPAGEAYMIDDELMPFEKPCDNCAFRGKSEERQDKQGWEVLLSNLQSGAEFYCHKGVPFDLKTRHDDTRPFEYPRRPDGTPDRSRMRLCQGYLMSIVGPALRRHEEKT